MLTAVITGARKGLLNFVEEKTQDLLHDEDRPFLIRQPGAEEALGHADKYMLPGVQYDIRDAIRTEARRARIAGVSRCLVLGFFWCSWEDQVFKECEQLVLRGVEEVQEWNFFDNVIPACLTPRPEIVVLPA